ncbi:uncharacterized protein LOC124898569 [Capsicum annuum]|uniref:uncharacterized protein LOC124898569 n=1 Tax=Capsicum annuum TaxID=4072 RepID=UPI001FB09249|nr:uncharacterized protein LOC124898569 [Capsicum annuum]
MIAELARKLKMLQEEMNHTRDLANLAITVNAPAPGGHGTSLQILLSMDHYEEKEKKWRTEHEMKLIAMNEEIIRIKESHGARDHDGLGYDDLCVHPGIDLPEGYNVPKFKVFDGTGNPMANLRRYCDQMVGVGKNKALLIRLFSRSLSGEALEWFLSQELKRWTGWKALAKGFLDRKEAAKVQPPMSEEEIVYVFSCDQEGEYYTSMVFAVRATFADLVKIEESLEEGIRTGIIAKTPTSSRTAMLLKKEKEDVGTISVNSIAKMKKRFNSRNIFSSPLSLHFQHPHVQSTLPNNRTNIQVPPNYHQVPPPAYQNHYNPLCPNIEKKPPRNFTPLAESHTQLFERWKNVGHLQTIQLNPVNPNSRFDHPDQNCVYHSGAAGHNTEDYINLKYKIQDLIDQKVITLQSPMPTINSNSLANHGGPTVNMIEIEEE